MKTTKLSIIDMVSQLVNIIELRKAQDKVEKELKATLKEYMGSDATLEAGEFMVLIETRNRSDLDRKALTVELGLEKIAKFTKYSSYEILTVKSTQRGDV